MDDEFATAGFTGTGRDAGRRGTGLMLSAALCDVEERTVLASVSR